MTGLLLADAVNSIAGAGLGVGFVSSAVSSEVATGAVLSTDPPGGTEVGPGQLVSIALSDGPPPEQPAPDLFVVPDVLGFRFEEARATLQGAGWTVAVMQEFSTDEDFGLIIRQEPAGGSLVPPGNVAIALSKGSPPSPTGPPQPPDQPLVE